ncbi:MULTISPECIES: cytochrome P450 [Streptomyces]|uniref:Cytochrome P450 n=1 Tax=Streptomyces viridosporus (strain ATCC 14672 / DSM 40746 / JCM 4963 / KCTC 9882 / NRRL B-12104 / FH 1290) TaxID=566461 RepID=D5ZRR4_STRV1|nr:cytochrome P450 [Streptomyces sp. NWU49]EFE66577.1 cytochrome P450 [Streptomyces viridosporus ATCC 14672]PWJ04656.1 cytochrome P450 [Streptomyces sp. NWU49]
MAVVDQRPTAARCPVTSGFKPFDQDGTYEFFSLARHEAPVFYNEETDYWVVTRRQDVLSVFKDPARFSAANVLDPLEAHPEELTRFLADNGFTVEPVQSNTDRPKHGRIRQCAGQFLNPKRYRDYEPRIRALVQEYVHGLRGKDEVDIVAELTHEMPARVVFMLLGVDDVDPLLIKRWALNRATMIWGKPTRQEMIDAGHELNDFFHFCKGIVEDRKRAPRDDYPSRLLELRGDDDSVLTENEIVCLVFALLLAGHEAVTNGLTISILTLLEHREAWEELVADPALIPRAVEEVLRHSTPVLTWRRKALEDVELSGVTIPAGSKVLLSLASANHDEDRYARPSDFDIHRVNARDHLSFGYGVHVCMGAPLARAEMRIVLEELVDAFPGMELVEGQQPEWTRTMAHRGPQSLKVRLGGSDHG